jgi:hypothetical protein
MGRPGISPRRKVQLVYGDVHIDPELVRRLILSQEMNGKVLAKMHLDQIEGRDRRRDPFWEENKAVGEIRWCHQLSITWSHFFDAFIMHATRKL